MKGLGWVPNAPRLRVAELRVGMARTERTLRESELLLQDSEDRLREAEELEVLLLEEWNSVTNTLSKNSLEVGAVG